MTGFGINPSSVCVEIVLVWFTRKLLIYKRPYVPLESSLPTSFFKYFTVSNTVAATRFFDFFSLDSESLDEEGASSPAPGKTLSFTVRLTKNPIGTIHTHKRKNDAMDGVGESL
mmetsp:Transcript_77/g.68  ORF Transcript_77/g.68 Transcript_77/m.68 type:complete len:114 (-) Transcript_77:440-781(-)|eukprot:CAMPEP_0184744954 /NCGR_PEP_ID=MMETSP0315-20130426/7710_1 /TAXON_ID=101924 /ORGANISM="Rhodosorus marinus, Strain UTEX LB 2760" /LENGTH=113 /DNA_ID=CAMNT_0027216945 /DNA_START=220 /DNA_END=561 /DNA_ORIENTATION=-